jgi:hypothetical protein
MSKNREERNVRLTPLALFLFAFILPAALSGQSHAQSIRLGPGGVEISPGPEERGPPPRPAVRDELRERMFRLREACEDGDRRACVRFGMILGENRERQAEWRREHPDLFSFER